MNERNIVKRSIVYKLELNLPFGLYEFVLICLMVLWNGIMEGKTYIKCLPYEVLLEFEMDLLCR